MKRDSSARRFISQLGALPCIGDDGKPLQPVRNFHTHKKVIFCTFPKHFQVLPDIFLQKDGQWFENLGLQQQVSSEVFINPRRACAARVTVVVPCVCVCVCVCFQGLHLRLMQLSDKLGILVVSVSCSLVFKFGVFRIIAFWRS